MIRKDNAFEIVCETDAERVHSGRWIGFTSVSCSGGNKNVRFASQRSLCGIRSEDKPCFVFGNRSAYPHLAGGRDNLERAFAGTRANTESTVVNRTASRKRCQFSNVAPLSNDGDLDRGHSLETRRMQFYNVNWRNIPFTLIEPSMRKADFNNRLPHKIVGANLT